MSSKDFFEQLKAGQEPSLVETIQAIAPGLSLSKILGDIGEELTQQAVAGAHEMASALFRGDAFVMYPRTNQAEEPDHGLTQQEQQQEQGRDGREM
ncbi:MAG TPA: hypothetical protein VN688_26770 [Gemmataceae bacterium]|nr:hypothetical protein [Gemmataceae bacterium]